mgnify:CR=1 FL=1
MTLARRLDETPRSVVRVIAGLLGEAPRGAKGRDTRPTSDRVRESVFMRLEPLSDLRVVDLFAGSGALGIEALSRGAAHVDFVEARIPAMQVLVANLDTLGLAGRARTWRLELPGAMKRLREALAKADLVLMDPPYGGSLAVRTLEALGEPSTLRPGTTVVVEHHGKDDLPERLGSLERRDQRRYGETRVSMYRVAPPETDHTEDHA